MLGSAIRRAWNPIRRTCGSSSSAPAACRTRFQRPRAGLINSKFDKAFLDNLTKDPKKLTRIPHLEFMREAGAEGIEMVMWLIMRGALDDDVEEVYRFYTVPASNTAVGHIILENKRRRQGQEIGDRQEAGRGQAKRAAARANHRNVRRGM